MLLLAYSYCLLDNRCKDNIFVRNMFYNI